MFISKGRCVFMCWIMFGGSVRCLDVSDGKLRMSKHNHVEAVGAMSQSVEDDTIASKVKAFHHDSF